MRFERERKDANCFAGSMTLFVRELRSSVSGELQVCQFESAEAFVISLGGDIGEDFASRGGMTSYAVDAVFANLHTSGRHLDKPLEESTNDRFIAGRSQQAIPLFMGFPVVAVIEEVDGQQEAAVLLPVLGGERFDRTVLATVAVPARMPNRVRRG